MKDLLRETAHHTIIKAAAGPGKGTDTASGNIFHKNVDSGTHPFSSITPYNMRMGQATHHCGLGHGCWGGGGINHLYCEHSAASGAPYGFPYCTATPSTKQAALHPATQ